MAGTASGATAPKKAAATAEPISAVSAKSSKASSSSSSPSSGAQDLLVQGVFWGLGLYVLSWILKAAYSIRLGAIREFGPVIHEFDPYFNYRATEYLYWNGWQRFFSWFDHKVWYPLGRPVGTTIYPGMQFTAVWIKQYLLPKWSLNDVCVYVPTWFGVIATLFVGAIAYEATVPQNASGNAWQYIMDLWNGTKTIPKTRTGSSAVAPLCSLFAMAIMSIVPAHLMRSMGGGFDNESVAMTAMVSTFYFWMRSLRTADPYSHWIFGLLSALAYFYMVASWGGYVFVLNLVGMHAAVLVALGRFDVKVWAAYTLFYGIGTFLAIQVPVVGWAPLKSLEQLGPCLVFMIYQLLFVCDRIRDQRNLNRKESMVLRAQVLAAAGGIGLVLVIILAPTGYFGPISARVRGLFVQHTKTGNPLVDSVAEHQPASSRAYWQYLHHACTLAPIGFAMTAATHLSDASLFLVVWGVCAYFFSHKMVRLILLTAPIASVLGGIAAGRLFYWCVQQWWEDPRDAPTKSGRGSQQDNNAASGDDKGASKKKKVKAKGPASSQDFSKSSFEGFMVLQDAIQTSLQTTQGVIAMRTLSLVLLVTGYFVGSGFVDYCWMLSHDLSNPSIILKARTRNGDIVTLDDYREAYWWLRDNTPEDSRIMAWWDYGYQISAIANRTTIADGNTWNHEHIALLGKALTTDLDQGWEIARHLADYVLVWGGGGGDDLAKSPHLARIANSVYRDHCPDDPTCRVFGFLDRQGTPSAMMGRSLLYRLHSHKLRPGVEVPADKFMEVYRSEYGKVRIFKILGVDEESKAWVADESNRRCDVPGSWFCPGQYPPGLSAILSKKKDFSQLEDFNKKAGADDEYTRKYFEDLQNPHNARQKILEKEREIKAQQAVEGGEESVDDKVLKERIEHNYKTWEDTEDTTRMWQLISSNNVNELKAWLDLEPDKAFIRSKDGRGPMFWAFEQRNEEITKLLMKAGVPHTDKDARGATPLDILEGQSS